MNKTTERSNAKTNEQENVNGPMVLHSEDWKMNQTKVMKIA